MAFPGHYMFCVCSHYWVQHAKLNLDFLQTTKFLVWVCSMHYLGYTYTKNKMSIYLTFKGNWESSVFIC